VTSLDGTPFDGASVVEGHPRRWWALAVLCLTLAMVALDNTILNVALPHIADQLHAGERDLQWITTAYGLVLAGLLLPLAVVGDRWGRRAMLIAGLVVFGAASGVASMATSPATLVACRGLMGVGGACAMPATLSLLGNLFPEHERGRAIAIWSAVAGVSAATGPVVGGILVSRFWWGSVLLVNVPVAAVAVIAAIALVPESRDRQSPPVDRRSALAWWAALTAALIAIIELPTQGARSPLVLGAGLAAIVLFVLFRAQEARTDGPLVDAATAADPRMAAGAATMGALFFAMFGCQFVVTQWLQGPRGLSAIAAGLCFVPSALVSIVTPLRNPGWVARRGHGMVAAAGLATVAVGAAGVGLAIAERSVAGTVAAFTLIGAGVGAASPSGAELIMSSAPPARAGSAAGVNETIVEASGALGVAVLGSVLAGGHSFARPLPVAAAVALVAAWSVRRLLPPTRLRSGRVGA
jgi:MFS family permease